MAKKLSEYVVIDGCIEHGRDVFAKGAAYTPPSAEMAAELVKAGKIAAVRSPAAQAVLRQTQPEESSSEPDDEKDNTGA